MRDEAEDFWNAIRMGRSARSATRHGHTIERVGSGGRTVALELGLVQTHLRDVLRDLHLGDAVNYVHNVMNGHGFGEALSDAGMLEHRQALERSEEHTSELQSLMRISYAVFCLKKKTKAQSTTEPQHQNHT